MYDCGRKLILRSRFLNNFGFNMSVFHILILIWDIIIPSEDINVLTLLFDAKRNYFLQFTFARTRTQAIAR
jgi:hypothetical protein